MAPRNRYQFKLCSAVIWLWALAWPAEADSCHPSQEGRCRRAGEYTVDICAAGQWQEMFKGSFECVNSQMLPLSSTLSQSVSSPFSGKFESDCKESTPTNHASAYRNMTGYSVCTNTTTVEKHDAFGTASYAIGGKMASVYYASRSSIFRCNSSPPPSNYYVALWTQYNGHPDASQPQPINCNDMIKLKNPILGRTATAKVIDRCASCVGVGHRTNDPTTPECLVNGATIDLSLDLWNYLYNGAPLGVYDIEYFGSPYLGWTEQPFLLTSLTTSECSC